MAACCGCCSALKPRWKRLVDNIFPVNPEDGLVKNEMDKLTFYAISSPEKLDRIGTYLEKKLASDIHRRRIGLIFVAMDALDQLLVSCHSHSLNLFVESFLKMVQKLLELDEPDLQILATQSFVKFTNIEEDTPSYHRRYDFFVSKFSSMCHSGTPNEETRTRIQSAGLRGLQGVVRKTASDDLQVNIWEDVHMDKIVPSLLYNMHNKSFMCLDMDSPKDEEHPAYIAEQVFRDLVCRGSYGNIRTVLRPVLIHMDNHKLWVPNDFANKCFNIIMYSVQQQYAYLVIQMLMSHLDKCVNSDPAIKTSIIDVLFHSVLIAAGGSLGSGPSVLDVFNTLLRHLRISVDNKSQDEKSREMEKKFEEAIIIVIGEFANHLPDYQKIEIMMFVMGKFPQLDQEEIGISIDIQLQTMLLKTLQKVAATYKTIYMSNTFHPEFLTGLLQLSQLDDPSMRITVQEILHSLIDRHNNTSKFKTIVIQKDLGKLALNDAKVSGQDSLFMKKNNVQFYTHIMDNIQMESNKVDNYEALYCTMCLLAVELGSEEILTEMLRLGLDIQQGVLSHMNLPLTHKCAIHGLVAAFINLVAQLVGQTPLCQYVKEVIEVRRDEAPYLLPDFAFNRSNRPSSYSQIDNIQPKCLFDQATLQQFLVDCGQDASRLTTPIAVKPFSTLGVRNGDLNDIAVSGSASDVGSINLDLDSAEGSPIFSRRWTDEEITVEYLKKMLAEDNTEKKEEEAKKRQEIYQTYRTAPFEEIVARSEQKSCKFHNKLTEILDMVSRPPDSPERMRKSLQMSPKAVFDVSFPDLFVY
ncbi:protein EFR3 homolog B-like [Ylistrum balloti]|uniref:protein EFR3 homolog B-like n=1 Tax=Ylistrum balloti TaxID=509963 RepID=UPI002905DD65|nr:protein EFR3 homolog B-like [Ylistrum balloti]